MEVSLLENWIVLEGLDGSGTTTQSERICHWLDELEVPVIPTCEPTGGPIGRLIRSFLRKEAVTTPLAIAGLYAADRDDHLHNPQTGLALHHKDSLIISDRYFYSSLAYQSVQVPFETVSMMNRYPHPRYLIYIDTPVEICLARMKKRGAAQELFEYKEYLEEVTSFYERAFSELPEEVKFLRVDGSMEIEDIFLHIKEFMQREPGIRAFFSTSTP
ncbi:dTMP kinase [Parasphaerochaeta coccoides]|uniref:Thymidylate kinase n=1 Tax=Parasphaerochaeta coccoides (strain ATCC BAA-1237 / DSM 17374 / SPN1) TaxID=760011 RepID=F4GK43_PARC1|nr:dTMP kinase [Parasphaerochaeta coccoides]AEC01815.1 Thymidylate kinase [Parasphaerochaeta coccoides DSM 17374]